MEENKQCSKVWISGANGHLGQALCTRLDREKYQLIATDVAEVDVTVPAEVRAFADANRPDVIINCTGFMMRTAARRTPTALTASTPWPPATWPLPPMRWGQDGAVLHR